MSHRPIAGFLLLLVASCLAGQPPAPKASAPSDKAAKAPESNAAASTEGCGKFKIQSKQDLDACNKKCNDDRADQQRQCTDPQCQQGIGQGSRVCLGKCDEGQKSAQAGKCYKE